MCLVCIPFLLFLVAEHSPQLVNTLQVLSVTSALLKSMVHSWVGGEHHHVLRSVITLKKLKGCTCLLGALYRTSAEHEPGNVSIVHINYQAHSPKVKEPAGWWRSFEHGLCCNRDGVSHSVDSA